MKPSSSYPYLRIAREMNLPYWAILLAAEHRMRGEGERVWGPAAAVEAIQCACDQDGLRRCLERIDAAIAEFRVIQAEGWD